jgi:WD40 repeat protein
VVNWFGSKTGGGTLGGQFSNPRDIAVNSTGAGPASQGDVYVVDEGNNRIERFDAEGNFISAWGANVLTAAVSEVQTLTVNATGGSFTLSFEGETTAAIAYNASDSTIQTALRNLPSVDGNGVNNVQVSQPTAEGPYAITFNATLAATNVPQLGIDGSLLAGSASVVTTTEGSGQYEICTAAANCRQAPNTGGANHTDNTKNGSLSRPQSVAVDGDTGNVYVSDRDNRRVNEYTGDGTFIRSFGFGVDASTAGNGYEVCPAADRCTFGVAGAGAGQVGATTTAGTLGVAVSPPDGNAATGTVSLADSQNRRVNTYALDGTSPSSFGSSATFEATQPRKIAVDSRGILYASNSKNQGEVERYDTENANGDGVGFLAPILAANSSPGTGPLLAGSAATATSGLAVHPDSDGAGTDTDVLYVLRESSSGNTVVQQFGPANDPGLTGAPTAVDDTHGSGAGFTIVNGLGLDDSSGHLFVSVVGDIPGVTGFPSRVYVLGEAPAPEATLDPVTSFDAHSATFSGTVDPNGALTNYRFEYVDDAAFQANGFTGASRTPSLSDAGAGHGENPVSVTQKTPDHLVAGTTYHVRLFAKRAFSPVEVIAGPQVFTTPSSAPTVDGTGASVTGSEEAILRGAINPENEAVTGYHFEWGTDSGYGNSTPAGSLPQGSGPVAVAEELTELAPGQTYHYRLLVTNATGTATGPDQTFTTPAGPPQLPERGYEVVSPLPSEGIPILPGLSEAMTNENGNRLIFQAVQPLPGSLVPLAKDEINQGSHWIYEARREPAGWKVISTRISNRGGGGYAVSADTTRMLTHTENGLDPDDQNGDDPEGRRYDVYQRRPDGTITWISRDPRIPAGTAQTSPGNAVIPDAATTVPTGASGEFSMSADGSTVVFMSDRQLLDADTTPPPLDPTARIHRLYKWQEGQLSFIGARPDGSAPSEGSMLGSMFGTQIGETYQHTVSRDGSRVVFSAPRADGINTGSAGKTLYVQTDGQPTLDALKESGVPPVPASELWDPVYRAAAADDSRIFYTTQSRLTPDSGAQNTSEGDPDLYAFDVVTDEVRDLTPRLDGIEDPAAEPAAGDRGGVLGVPAVSEGGRRAYFVAQGRYPVAPSPEGQLPVAGSPNLYLAELDGIGEPIRLRFVATLGTGDNAVWGPWRGRAAEASPDGSTLAFGSSADLVSGHPTGGTEQMYVYDARTETLACASCPADGSLPAGGVEVRFPGGGEFPWQFEYGERHWVTEDGAVFFDTPTALLPGDRNNAGDVYEYHGGELHLISGGVGTSLAKFENASLDGSSVFFTTSEALAAQDDEPGISKLYVARAGGGLPSSAPAPPCDLSAGACEGAGTAPRPSAGAGTAAFEGPGNPRPKRPARCPKGKRGAHRKGGVRCVKHHRRRRDHDKRHHKRNAKHNRRAGR